MSGSIGDRIRLNNGVMMPRLGFGTAGVNDPELVAYAAEVGYRNFDTATDYANESIVGKGLKDSGIDRGELFVTTKVWNSKHGYEKTLKAFEFSRKELLVDYVDLYLIHWPCPDFNLYVETWKAMEKLYKDGHIRAIGVANFRPEWLERILNECEVVPVVNQVEYNPYHQNVELRKYCASKGILMACYTPTCRGKLDKDKRILSIAGKYGKTAVQTGLRFLVQDNVIPLPKSTKKEHIRSNADIFDFELTQEEMQAMRDLNEEKNWSGEDPYKFHVTTDRLLPIGFEKNAGK